MSIEWMSDEQCSKEFERAYPDFRQNPHFRILPQFSFDISSDELTQTIPFSPSTNPRSFDEPGPVDVWFGRSHTSFFNLVYYKGKDCAIVATHAQRSDENYPWSILQRFTDLPNRILRNVVWISSHLESARVSVFFENHNGIKIELYRSVTEPEATELIAFLKSIGCGREFYLSTPDDLHETWIIVKMEAGCPNKVVARYNSRIAAQTVAHSFSLRDGAIYQSIRETPRGHSGVSFQNGKILPG